MNGRKIPSSFKNYFWDVDYKKLEADKHAFFIIKRVLDRGKTQDVKWLQSHFGNEKIREVVTKSRDLSKLTANFWSMILNIDSQKVPCLQKPYSPIRFGLSS